MFEILPLIFSSVNTHPYACVRARTHTHTHTRLYCCFSFHFFFYIFIDICRFLLVFLDIAFWYQDTPCEFFYTNFSRGTFTEVFPGLKDSSQYSGQSQQCCNLGDLNPSSDFQPFQPFFQMFVERSNRVNYNWHHRHPHVPQLS